MPNAYWAVACILITEVMFFGGLVSAFLVSRGTTAAWPPPGQPRLPIERTALNTAVLLLSAWPMLLAVRERRGRWPGPWIAAVSAAGAAFVALQGAEWVRLVAFGLTATSSLYGAFFYLLVGAHAVHAVVGLGLLAAISLWFRSERALMVGAIYWFFVIALWPVLYALVYLS